MLPLSLFDKDGVDVGSGTRNMNYLYGLSDFFSYVFEDTETVNVMLEANAVSSSEIYSNFLQITSSLTLSGIQTDVGVSIKLILVKDSDQEGLSPKFKINVPIASAKYLTNRPFLPTEVLEFGVDFDVTQIDSESCYIEFAKPLEDYSFSRRPTTTEVVEYAIWATDVKLDESLMYKHYGKILGVSPEVSSEQFSNFIYGLYYLYLNGPTLQTMEQGLNLVLGIPLVRETGVIIDIRYNTEAGNYLIITDKDSYVLPEGILPIVEIDDEVGIGDSLAKWVELKDYRSDGAWWINVSIPSSVIRSRSGNQVDRYASAGSNFDYLMSNYLYKNTFLVRINTGEFKYNKYFNYLTDILSKAKPAYTQPVYIWKITLGEDTIPEIFDDGFSLTISTTYVSYDIDGYAINDQNIN
jgi:hypothetical protein